MLEDIFDEIIPEDSILEKEEFIESILHIMDEYITTNPKAITEPDFHETFINDVHELIISQFSQEFWDDEEEDLEEIIEETVKIFYESVIPMRSHPNSIILHNLTNEEKNKIQKQIDYLTNIPQPLQRTPEWYIFRNNLITASNAYKAFENQNTQNQLIWEKCQGYDKMMLQEEQDHNVDNTNNTNIVDGILDVNCKSLDIDNKDTINVNVSVNGSRHWGQKYEPLSVMIYEDMYNTQISDFGCIQHTKYSFLGASPDGINTSIENPRFGRMLEIKNIVNREIDSIPKVAYWVQMQLQMETCDLNECDFLETQFVEYENEEEYLKDDETLSNKKGIIMYFSNPHLYVYAPLRITENKKEYEEWENQMMKKHEGNTWIKNIYWKCEILSCVLVERNQRWFQDNIDELSKVWKIIEKERNIGYQHRAPMKRMKKEIIPTIQGCLLNINKESGKIELSSSKSTIQSK